MRDFLFFDKIYSVTDRDLGLPLVLGCQNCRFAQIIPALVIAGEVNSLGMVGNRCPETGCSKTVFVSWDQMGNLRKLPPFIQLFAVAVQREEPKS